MKIHKKLGFTLVELIVVIVILGVLSTIGFVSYNGYLGGTRDSNRVTQLKNITDSLNLYTTRNDLPLPDDYVLTTAGSTPIGYQGYIGLNTLDLIDYTNGGTDPKDDTYFTYYLDSKRKNFQLLAFLEETDNIQARKSNDIQDLLIPQTYAADYSNRFPKTYGSKLGVLVLASNNTPIQEVGSIQTSGSLDIQSTPTEYTAYLNDTDTITGTGGTLVSIIPNGSCNRIKQTGGSKGSGVYTINPGGNGDKDIFCYIEAGEAVEDMLEGEGDFTNGQGISTFQGESPTNVIENIQTPISSNYALHQTGGYSSQYIIDFKDATQCQVGEHIYMTAWVSLDDGGFFHSRIYNGPTQVMFIDTRPSTREVLETKVIGGISWNKYRYKHLITSPFTRLRWFIGYGAEGTNGGPPETDFYITGIRLSCH